MVCEPVGSISYSEMAQRAMRRAAAEAAVGMRGTNTVRERESRRRAFRGTRRVAGCSARPADAWRSEAHGG